MVNDQKGSLHAHQKYNNFTWRGKQGLQYPVIQPAGTGATGYL